MASHARQLCWADAALADEIALLQLAGEAQTVDFKAQFPKQLAQGGITADACRRIGVTEQTYYRWRKEYGGLKVDQARRMKDLERENARLRQAIADLTLDKLILQEAARGNF